jgi:hypothetical protein
MMAVLRTRAASSRFMGLVAAGRAIGCTVCKKYLPDREIVPRSH